MDGMDLMDGMDGWNLREMTRDRRNFFLFIFMLLDAVLFPLVSRWPDRVPDSEHASFFMHVVGLVWVASLLGLPIVSLSIRKSYGKLTNIGLITFAIVLFVFVVFPLYGLSHIQDGAALGD